MAKSKYSRIPPRKIASTSTMILMFILVTFIVLVLLALGMLSIPSNSATSHKANDLSTIAHNQVNSGGDDEGGKEQWVEVISWEPRAFVYHNFLSKIASWK